MEVSALPVVTDAAQAAVVTGLAVDTAGLAPGGRGVSMVSSDWFIEVIYDGQVGGRGVGGRALKEDDTSDYWHYTLGQRFGR